MAEDWTFDITQVKPTEVKEPLGFSASAFNVEDSKARREEVNNMKINKAFGLVMGQGKSIFTTFISSFFIGSSVSMFTIAIYSYNIYNSLNTIFNVNKAFKMYEGPEYSLLSYKILYILLSLISFLLICYKINKMGFLPLNAADWAAFANQNIPNREILNLNFK